MDQPEEYHDVEITTNDGKMIMWRESEIQRNFPSLISSLPIKRSQRRIVLLIEVPLCSFTVSIIKEFCQLNEVKRSDITFADYEFVLKNLLKFRKDEYLPLQNYIFSVFFKDIESFNCIGIWILAKKYANELYVKKSKQYILEHIYEYCKNTTIDFYFYGRLKKDDIIDIVSDDELNIQTEEDVILIILTWTEVLPNERNIHLKELLHHVRKEGLSKSLKEISTSEMNIQISELNLSSKPSREVKDKLLILGGHTTDGLKDDVTSSIELYDLVNNVWLKLNNQLPFALSYHAAQYFDNSLYIFGGTCVKSPALPNAWKYADRKWTEISPMSQARTYITNTSCIYNNEIYVIGGHDGQRRGTADIFQPISTRLKSVEKYNAAKDEWTVLCDMNHGRSDASCTVFNERIYVFGGFDGNRILDSIEMYVPDLDNWIVIESKLPSPRSGFASILTDDRIWIVGGSEYNQKHSTVFSYQPKKDLWIIHNEMNIKRSNFTLNKLGRRLIVAGGYYREILDSVEVMVNNDWMILNKINNPRSALASVIIPYSYFKANFI